MVLDDGRQVRLVELSRGEALWVLRHRKKSLAIVQSLYWSLCSVFVTLLIQTLILHTAGMKLRLSHLPDLMAHSGV